MSGRRRAEAGAQGTPDGARPVAPTPLRLWPRVAAVVLVLVVGVTAAAALAQSAQRDADQREELLAHQTGNLAAATIQQLVAAISGVSGLPESDGEVEERAFESYAVRAVEASPFETLAFAPVVPAEGRAAFEAEVGTPITDEPGGPPAPPRDWYLPVKWVLPVEGRTRSLIGFDLATDDVRRSSAEESRDTGTAVISRTVPSQPSGDPAVFVVHPVYRAGTPVDASVEERRANVIGYVTTGVLGEQLLSTISTQVEDPLGLRIEDAASEGGSPDAEEIGPLLQTDPAPDGGVTVDRDVGGRTWRVTVDDVQGASTAASWWLLAVTLVLVGTLAVFAWRAGRHQRQVARHVAVVDHLADLGRALAGTTSIDSVARVVAAIVPPALSAAEARLSVPAAPAAADGAARSRDSAGRSEGGPRRWPDDGGPPGRARGEQDELDEGREQDGRDRRTGDDDGRVTVRRGVHDAAGTTIGSIDVVWADADEVDGVTLAGLATVGEMCGQALGRARVIDLARRDAVTSRLLAGLAESASTAATADDVARRLVARAGDVPGATTTHIGLLTDDGHALRVTHQGLGTEGASVEVRGLDHPWPMLEAFRRNDAVLLGDIDAVRARFPAVADGIQAAGLEAVASLPLVGEDGVPFGAVTLTWATPQRFDSGLTTTLQATADLCASSLGRARATDRSQAGASALATLATHLSAARSFDEVGSVIVAHATRALSADFALVGVVEGDHLRLLAPEGPTLGPLAPYLETELSGDFPALAALRERRLVTFPSLDDIAAADPRVARDLEALDLRCRGVCPADRGRRRRLGRPARVVGRPTPVRRRAHRPAARRRRPVRPVHRALALVRRGAPRPSGPPAVGAPTVDPGRRAHGGDPLPAGGGRGGHGW